MDMFSGRGVLVFTPWAYVLVGLSNREVEKLPLTGKN